MTLAQTAPQTFDEDPTSLDTQAQLGSDSHADAPRVSLWFYGLLGLVVVLWGTSVLMFGVPGLYLPAVALVPVVFGLLIWISIG